MSNAILLTVIIPAYNESPTIGQVLDAVLKAEPQAKQIIVVDDGSSDATHEIVRAFELAQPIEVVHHPVNRGKGAAIRSGLAIAKGEYTVIQDADMEYDPSEYSKLLAPLLVGEADVAYGSRYLR